MVLWVLINPEGHHWIMPKFRFGVDLISSTMEMEAICSTETSI